MKPGRPKQMGAHHDGEGTNFALFSANAESVELCLFSPDGKRETARHTLPERTGSVWHGYLPGAGPGTLYGYRVHGPYAPERGHRFNANKLLSDPYARDLQGRFRDHKALLGYDPGSAKADLSFSKLDSAPFVPKSVVVATEPLVPVSERPKIDDDAVLIYEAHVKGLTREHPQVAESLRGTYDGLASDAIIEHLHKLGVTTIELMPVHGFVDDSFLLKKGLRNYWGYNSIGFFVPEPRYHGPAGRAGFRAMVQRFHAAGIEVILDVVYNHTAEGDQSGPTLSFRGIDNASYYRLLQGQPRYNVNDTGCGNTINAAHPYVLRMILDSLRYWVEVMGVDGFRFDLATTLGREDHGFDPNGGLFDAMRQDPVLSSVRLIAEPWDIGWGGYQLGNFPTEFAEWNDRFRDTSRRYWRGDDHSAQELAACLLGSAAQFDRAGRRAWSSVNFVASHDGFTLADVTRYDHRHNQANGEDGKDGHHANFSENCGAEGDTDDAEVLKCRLRRQRNLLATLFFSQGTPMLLGGDEIGNSQGGNNNAYCQDNTTGWVNWGRADADLTEYVAGLSALRRVHPSLRQSVFLHGGKRASDGLPDVEWRSLEGQSLEWRDPGLSAFGLILRRCADHQHDESNEDTVYLVFNRDAEPLPVTLPKPQIGSGWRLELDTAGDDPFSSRWVDSGTTKIAGHAMLFFSEQPLGGDV